MSIYNSIQSGTGQLLGTGQIVGLEVPFTEAEVSLPPIPVAEMHFDNDMLAIGGTAVLIGGAILGRRHRHETSDRLDKQFPAGRDESEVARKPILRDRRKSLIGLAAVTAAVSGVMLDKAGPHVEESVPLVDSVAMVIDAGYEGYADDVLTEDGSTTTRLEATINTIKQLSLDDTELEVIAAGSNPISLGTITDGSAEDRQEVIDRLTDYTSGISQKGSPESGGGDIDEALAIVDPDADKVVIFTGTIDGHTDSSLFRDENLPENHRLATIAVGQPGSTVETRGNEYAAPIEPAFNEKYVGADDSHVAASTSELEDVINDVIDAELTEDVREDLNIFKKMYTYAAVTAGLLLTYQSIQDSRRRNKPTKGNK